MRSLRLMTAPNRSGLCHNKVHLDEQDVGFRAGADRRCNGLKSDRAV